LQIPCLINALKLKCPFHRTTDFLSSEGILAMSFRAYAIVPYATRPAHPIGVRSEGQSHLQAAVRGFPAQGRKSNAEQTDALWNRHQR